MECSRVSKKKHDNEFRSVRDTGRKGERQIRSDTRPQLFRVADLCSHTKKEYSCEASNVPQSHNARQRREG